MLRSNLSLWFDLTKVLLFICILALNAEIKMTKLHLGILETHQDIQEELEQVQPGECTQDRDIERLQISYALSSMYHLQLTVESLYNSNNDFMYISEYDVILFDVEAASMLATVQSVPLCKPLKDILWLLLFYTDKVHRLLKASSEDQAIDSLKIQFMFKAHQYIKESLRHFVVSNMGKFEDVKKKLDEINNMKISDSKARTELISKNKELLSSQMAFNEKYGFLTDDKIYISFESITTSDRLDKIESIVVEYIGKKYWSSVKNALREMYDTAMNLDVTISYQVLCLWHIKNSIIKILKLIFLQFIDSYIESTSKWKKFNMDIKLLDQATNLKISEFYGCLGKSPDGDYLVEMFADRYSYPDDISEFYSSVKRNINQERYYYPDCTKIDKIFKFYSLLFYNPKMVLSKKTQKREKLDFYVDKVKYLFSEVNINIAISFYLFPYSKTFRKLKEIEYPIL